MAPFARFKEDYMKTALLLISLLSFPTAWADHHQSHAQETHKNMKKRKRGMYKRGKGHHKKHGQDRCAQYLYRQRRDAQPGTHEFDAQKFKQMQNEYLTCRQKQFDEKYEKLKTENNQEKIQKEIAKLEKKLKRNPQKIMMLKGKIQTMEMMQGKLQNSLSKLKTLSTSTK